MSRTTPLVSIIVPIFKTERYVEKCLRSVMAQTYENLEILCINDDTPDQSAEIVAAIAKEDPRIRLLEHERNQGLGAARNTGLLAARGEYIASVDSDDYVAPDMIQALVDGTMGGVHDVVVCGFQRVTEQGDIISNHLPKIGIVNPDRHTNIFKISNPAFWNKLWRNRFTPKMRYGFRAMGLLPGSRYNTENIRLGAQHQLHRRQLL